MIFTMKFAPPTQTRRLLIAILCALWGANTAFAQVHIREKVEITNPSVVPSKAISPPPGIPSGFVIPRSSGLRTSLQVQYGLVQKLDYEMPPYATFNTYFRDSTKSSSLNSRLPIGISNWWEYYNGCTSQYEWRQQYQYEPSVSTEWDTVGRVSRGDTITFAYISNRIDQPSVRDTIPILITDTLKVRESNGDSVVVGWNVTLGRYNQCINEYNDHLDAFIGLNCATYSRLSQGAAGWRDKHYLWAYYKNRTVKKIKDFGCALTAMAMLGQAMGLAIDPDTLNGYMKSSYTFGPGDSASVQWDAMNSWQGQLLFRYAGQQGKKVQRYPENPDTTWITRDTLRLGIVDSLLNRCYSILAEVANHKLDGKIGPHWVIVTSKNAQGEYPIYDPGYSTRKFLSAYANHIYRIARYVSK